MGQLADLWDGRGRKDYIIPCRLLKKPKEEDLHPMAKPDTGAAGVLRNVFSNRNILAISFTTTLWSLGNNAWQQNYWSLWLKEELGVSIALIGVLSTIQSAEQMLFQLPGGIIADKFGRRRIILFGTSLRLIPPIIYILATNWEQILLATIINASSSIYMPAFEAIVADSLPSRQRGAGYGAYRMITSLPRIFMPSIGGVVMDAWGYRDGVRFFNITTIFLVIIVVVIRARYITETLAKTTEKRSTKTTFTDALKVPRSIWAMMIVATVSGFALRMVMQLTPIFVKEVIGLSNTEMGFAATASSLVSSLLIMPSGMLSDRMGRKPLILTAELLTPLTTLGIMYVNGFPQYLMLQILVGVGAALGGRHFGFAGGPAWQALIADLVPKERRGTVMGLQSTIGGIAGTPAPIIGSYVWEGYSPITAFVISGILTASVIPIFLFFVKEPRKSEE